MPLSGMAMVSEPPSDDAADLNMSRSEYEDLLGPPRQSIPIFHVPTKEQVSARVVRLTGKLAFEYIKKKWWSNLGVDRAILENEEDYEWDWRAEARRVAKKDDFGCYAALTTVNEIQEIQGAIVYDLRGQTPGPEPRPAVYGKYLATAPRNRESVVGVGKAIYRGVGEGLLTIALLDSFFEGYRGRMFLQSLDRAVDFYRKRGFKETIDSKDGTLYYEIEEEEAKALLVRRGIDLWRR